MPPGARYSAKDGYRDGGLIDNIYRDGAANGRNSRSNSLHLRPGEEADKYGMPVAEKQRSELLGGFAGAEEEFDAERLMTEGCEDEAGPAGRALYDPELEANWIEMAVSTSVFFPQRKAKRNYIYQYTLRIWDSNSTAEAAATGTLG